MLHSAETSYAADRRTVPPAGNVDQVGVYLTDEVFLYRVVDVLVTESGDMADVEDCYMLDVVRVPMCDVYARRLRVVT